VCIEVAAGSRFERREASHYTIDASKPQDYQRVFREVVSGDTVCRGVAHFWSLDAAQWGSTTAESLLADVRRGTLSALYVVQELVWQGSRDAPRLLLVTRGAQAAGGDASIASGSQAPLWGLGRTIAMEQPDLACTRVDLAPGGGSDEVAQVVREILSSDGEDQIAFRDDSRLVARLERGDIEPADAVALDPDATYLITGGLGGLGLTAARWMVSRGARHLMLLGRNNPTTTALEAIRVMEEAGARVRVRQVDVSRAPEVDGTLEYIEDNMPPLRGVVHAAGLIEDRTLQEMGEEQFSQPIRPKILGAWNLHRATRSIPLDFFVMYSSVAALLGSPGQGNYAAANAFLDALAHARVAEGLPAMSIQWGAFSEVGMVAEQESRGKRLAHRGIDSFTPDEGTELLSRLLQRPQVEVGLVRMSVRLWVEFYPRVAAMPFLAALREQEGRMSMSGALSPLRESLQDLSVAERRSALERHVLACLGRILRLAPERINAATPFKDYGMDSLMSLEIRNRLEPSLGLKLSAALLYTYPTAVALVDYLLIEMRFEAGGTADPADGLRASAAQIAVQLSEEAAAAMLNEKLLALEDYLK
jgi:NAD(P)-dependent dehydrogenase (short-subunit alcohol dehydrogenase family)/acyl carrier protein